MAKIWPDVRPAGTRANAPMATILGVSLRPRLKPMAPLVTQWASASRIRKRWTLGACTGHRSDTVMAMVIAGPAPRPE